MDAWYLALLPRLLVTLLCYAAGLTIVLTALYQIIWRAVRRGIESARDGQNRH